MEETKRYNLIRINKVVCNRCGGIGHEDSCCECEIPSISEIEQSIFNDIHWINEKESQTDKYILEEEGLCAITNKTCIKTALKGGNDKFCFNCGSEFHQTDKCTHINLDSLIKQFGRFMDPKCGKALSDVKEFFNDLWYD